MRTEYELRVNESVKFLKGWAKDGFVPEVVLILGSGLSGVFERGQYQQLISYNDLPGFKTTAVKGHAGELGLLSIGKTRVAVLMGRVHAYEGYDPGEVVHNIRAMSGWGAQKFVITNASGCLVDTWSTGSVLVLRDQINFTGLNPLTSPYGDGFGQRFIDMTRLFSQEAGDMALSKLKEEGCEVHEGVYIGVPGPSYETPAEVEMFRKWGAHAVGMSTVLETLAIRQKGGEILGLSALTNYAAGLNGASLDHGEVLDVGRQVQVKLGKALPKLIEGFAR